jgi:hypothetical protein
MDARISQARFPNMRFFFLKKKKRILFKIPANVQTDERMDVGGVILAMDDG